jgi:hypothetical protein
MAFDHVTGLSVQFGGLSIDHRGYTAEGLVEAIRTCVPEGRLRQMTAMIQGFGAVGAHVGRLLGLQGVRVRAVTNARGMMRACGDAGLDVAALFEAWHSRCDDGMAVHLQVRCSVPPYRRVEVCRSFRSPQVPTVLRIGPYKFSFFSNENNEPRHVQRIDDVQREC